ncbi:MAG: GxxExxY protein [Burkholderiales bacterium]|nr:GxxExxY protein [Burkholderiales bacterium]
MDANGIGIAVVDSASAARSALGPGLLEGACEACLGHESGAHGLCVERQVAVPIRHEGVEVDAGYRVAIPVSEVVIVELKSADRLVPLHLAQRLGYLKPNGKRLGHPLNCNVVHMRNGIERVVNGS